ncbi:UDP-glycosyltransferase 85A1 [Morella rubra]|uniref:UDP-glycosyltransferase 85A1 n=1 Tax=Morella rubra TaxID=262757 RepID=A0A6A1VMP7_9ROSI|nr:UDP-glycosyltransferase 85A1 [Morella rubra]
MHSGTVVVDKPHAVCIPAPFQSHIKAMLKFAKLLHRKGFHITFVNTEFNHQRFLKSGGPNSLDGLPDFRFETIPDSLPPSYINASSDLASVCESIMKNFLAPFSDLLVKLNTASSDNNSPPVTCIISDGFMAFTITAARELGIPIVMLFTIAACSLMAFKQFPSLMDKGLHTTKSLAVLTPRQLSEFGWGLANSKHPFLWIIRPDLVVGESAILPSEFEVETKERGLIAGWCPQEEVLNHPLIGGFLTHCGWNSIIESVSAGVPMLCWPFAWDQQTNCKYACNDWGIGLEIDNDVKRDEVEKLVRELMEGEKGKRMKKKVMEWKNLAVEATGAHGSSSVNLNNFVNEVLLSRG